MTEQDAQSWFLDRFDAAAVQRVGRFLDMVIDENVKQNLVAPSTIPSMWSRHALDSAQLLAWAGDGTWLDIGTGGGFPGMVVGLLRAEPILLVEPRRRRADFLAHCAAELSAGNVTVACSNVEQVHGTFDVITARAVAPVEKLLRIAAHCATSATQWLLPRGRTLDNGTRTLAETRFKMFHVEHSLSDPDSVILILEGEGRQ